MTKVIPALLLSAALMVPVGCKTSSATTPPAALAPGAVNQFDQSSYQALMAAQASLNSLKSSYTADPTDLAALKPALNQAIADYNIADLAYQTYHSAAVAGAATSAQQSAVTNSLTTVQNDLAKAGK